MTKQQLFCHLHVSCPKFCWDCSQLNTNWSWILHTHTPTHPLTSPPTHTHTRTHVGYCWIIVPHGGMGEAGGNQRGVSRGICDGHAHTHTPATNDTRKTFFGTPSQNVSEAAWMHQAFHPFDHLNQETFWVMSQQRQNSRKDILVHLMPGCREETFYIACKFFFWYSWRNWLTRTADLIRGRSTAVLFNIWKLVWSSYLMKN